MTASIAFVLTVLSALSGIMAQTQVCSLCNTGDVMSSSTSTIPAGTISFITEELSCVRVELLAQTAQWTAAQCTEAQASTAPTICGCMGESQPDTNTTIPDTNTTIPDTNDTIVENLVPITGQLILTLVSVQGEMPAEIETMYNELLSAFFGVFLTDGEGEVVKNVSAITVNQTLVDAATSRLRDLQTTAAALTPLDTWVEVTGLVVNGSELLLGTNFTDELIFIATNHSDKLIEATGLADSATNQTYFANVETVNATSTEPAEEPAPAPAPKPSTKKEEAPIGQTAGIIVGILAALLGAIFIASQIQGKHMLEEEEERRIAKEKLAKAKSLKQSKLAASEEDLED